MLQQLQPKACAPTAPARRGAAEGADAVLCCVGGDDGVRAVLRGKAAAQPALDISSLVTRLL
jgi:3-hydroxyisobutyrate dehydrogenase-like beta-hydroxyacid dehydrogenase